MHILCQLRLGCRFVVCRSFYMPFLNYLSAVCLMTVICLSAVFFHQLPIYLFPSSPFSTVTSIYFLCLPASLLPIFFTSIHFITYILPLLFPLLLFVNCRLLVNCLSPVYLFHHLPLHLYPVLPFFYLS